MGRHAVNAAAARGRAIAYGILLLFAAFIAFQIWRSGRTPMTQLEARQQTMGNDAIRRRIAKGEQLMGENAESLAVSPATQSSSSNANHAPSSLLLLHSIYASARVLPTGAIPLAGSPSPA